MNITIWTVTLNDDYSNPHCKVFASKVEALRFVFDYLDIDPRQRDEAAAAQQDGELNDWLNKHDYKTDGDTYVIESHEVPLDLNEKFAPLRLHAHAISLHRDCLSEDEHDDHAWDLACAVDKLDCELHGRTDDAWLATDKEAK